jgi:hypothetical protein
MPKDGYSCRWQLYVIIALSRKQLRTHLLTSLLNSTALVWRSIATQPTRNLASKDEQLESLSMARLPI